MIDIEEIARFLHDRGETSNDKNIEDRITEIVLDYFCDYIGNSTNEILEKMQELEHPEPRNKAEYDERFGLDKGE